MKMMHRAVVAIFCVALLCSLSACECKHEWTEATCTQPKTCIKCGETEGEPSGHEWSDWTVSVEAEPASDGLKKRVCTVCGEEETENYSLEKLFADGHLLLSPADFCERLTNKLYCQKAVLKGKDGEMAAGVTGVGGFDAAYEDGEAIAAIFFADGENVMGVSEKDECAISVLTVKFFTDDQAKIAHTMMGIIEACDGAVDTTGAGEIGKEIVSAYQLGEVYHADGIRYGLTRVNGSYIFMVTID